LFSLMFISIGISISFYLSKKESVSPNIHYSPITQKQYFDDFFSQAGECQNKDNIYIKGSTVNHHLLAGKFIAQGLCAVATDKKLTIILFSPNHFNHGNSSAISSVGAWQTPYGQLETNKELVTKLARTGVLSIDEQPFEEEHGVYNVTPFIKRTMPNSEIVPIIVKDNISIDEKNKLIEAVKNNLPTNSIIIASLDFSHYLTGNQADQEDEKSLKIIESVDYLGVKNLNHNNKPDNVDSKPVLEMFLNLMSQEGAKNFKLLDHSNSAKIIGDINLKETTSYIVGVFNMLI